jgi:hypothetical protein
MTTDHVTSYIKAYLPIVTAFIMLVAWAVRIEGRVTGMQEREASTRTSMIRIEDKIDRLSEDVAYIKGALIASENIP